MASWRKNPKVSDMATSTPGILASTRYPSRSCEILLLCLTSPPSRLKACRPLEPWKQFCIFEIEVHDQIIDQLTHPEVKRAP